MKNSIILIALLIAGLLFVSSCTINFKAKDLELESKPVEGKIGTSNVTNTSYELVSADILKNVNR